MDKYDAAVAYFQQNPEEILSAWQTPDMHEHGCLFMWITPGNVCLTQVKFFPGATLGLGTEFDAKVRADDNIPDRGVHITVEHLSKFAEYQQEAERIKVLNAISG